MTKWHLERPSIPASGAALSFIALALPVLSSTVLPDAGGEYEALIWMSALIPAFLLAYYRGWRGVALGFAAAMVVLTATQLYLLTANVRLPDWRLMLAITGMFICISLLLGGLVERLHQARAEAEKLALFDSLTSLPNRRYLDLMLTKSFEAARRGVPLVVVLMDLDDFKQYNDTYGHAAGDEALCAFADVLARNTRAMNLSARIGGEEFLSLAGASTVEGALVFVERVREALRQVQGLKEPITFSAGVAAYVSGMTTSDELLEAADEALYQAKRGGRDTIVAATKNADLAAEPEIELIWY